MYATGSGWRLRHPRPSVSPYGFPFSLAFLDSFWWILPSSLALPSHWHMVLAHRQRYFTPLYPPRSLFGCDCCLYRFHLPVHVDFFFPYPHIFSLDFLFLQIESDHSLSVSQSHHSHSFELFASLGSRVSIKSRVRNRPRILIEHHIRTFRIVECRLVGTPVLRYVSLPCYDHSDLYTTSRSIRHTTSLKVLDDFWS